MNKITVFLVIVIGILCFSLGATMQGKADEQGKSEKGLGSVIPFVTSNNRIGFFDQREGKIYMYDDNISQCIFVGQLPALGQPIQILQKSSQAANLAI